jgi:hypothetical protein
MEETSSLSSSVCVNILVYTNGQDLLVFALLDKRCQTRSLSSSAQDEKS